MKVFLDTNIFFDFIFRRIPFYEDAKKVVALANNGKTELFISALSLVNAVYVSKKYHYTEDAMRKTLTIILNFINVADLTKDNVISSLTSNWKDYEDCTQFKCAMDIDADYIVTRNEKDFLNSNIPVCSPVLLMKILNL